MKQEHDVMNSARYQDAVAAVLLALNYSRTEQAASAEGDTERARNYREFAASSMSNARSYFAISNSRVDAESLARRIDKLISEYQENDNES